MPFLNQQKGLQDRRNDFMIKLKKNYAAKLEFETCDP